MWTTHVDAGSGGGGDGGWSLEGKLSGGGGWESSIILLSPSKCVRAAEDKRRSYKVLLTTCPPTLRSRAVGG